MKYRPLQKRLPAETAAIVADSNHIRSNIASLVARSTTRMHESGDALVEIPRQVICASVATTEQRLDLPSERETILREVIDGLADGFSLAAQAISLALDEAHKAGKKYAESDTQLIANGFKCMGGPLVEAIKETGARFSYFGQHQADRMIDHAVISAQRVKPTLVATAAKASNPGPGITQEDPARHLLTFQADNALFLDALKHIHTSTNTESA
ncbi:MAG: hypothetical protein AAF514_22315 [Verrucomicrobiota bacterium]